MKTLNILMLVPDAATGPEVARLLREAGEHCQLAWPGAIPGGNPTVVVLRDAGGNLVGTATIGEAKP